MKILMCSINFSPELTGIGKYSGEMAGWLSQRGHDIRVVAAPPHYPRWKVHAGYSNWRFRKETFTAPSPSSGELEVFRCPLWIPRTPRQWKRVIHLLSFSLSTWPALLRQVSWKPDVVLLVAPTMFCAPQVLCAARLSGAVAWIHVQDFELDAAFELKDFSSNRLRRAIELLERSLMRNFDRGSSISGRMVQRLVGKGVDCSRSVLFPNWVDTSLIYPLADPFQFRRESGIRDDKVVALYSGSMGKKQGMESLVEVSRHLSAHPTIQFVFCGDGPAKEALARVTAQARNVTILPLQPLSRLNELLNMADVHLLPQVAGAADLVMPSKLTGMMASGRPVLATAESGTQIFDVLSGRGVVIPPGDTEAFASALSSLAEDQSLRLQLGREAREYAVAYMQRDYILSRFEAEMLEACVSGSNRRRPGFDLLRKDDDTHPGQVLVTSEVGKD
jgi:colanic acid biosynthesis glycosyl transferase WcaI